MTYSGMGQMPPVQPIPDPWYQQKARQLQALVASTATSGLGRMTHLAPPPRTATASSYSAPTAYKAPSMSYATAQKSTAARFLSGLGRAFGEESSAAPPPAGKISVPMALGWAAVLAATVGVFWAVTQGGQKPLVANRRRSSRRRSSRRRSSRRRVRRNVTRSDIERMRAEFRELRDDARMAETALRNRDARRLREVFGHHLNKPMVESLKRKGSAFFDDASAKLAVHMRIKAVREKADQLQRHIHDILDEARRAETSSRRSSRRTSRRRVRRNRSQPNLRRYSALTMTQRKKMPPSAFVFPERGDHGEWPIKGPPGSSRERDKWQAFQAIRYLNMGRVASQSDYRKIRSAIVKEYGKNFWRQYGGPSWSKVENAKRKRRRKR